MSQDFYWQQQDLQRQMQQQEFQRQLQQQEFQRQLQQQDMQRQLLEQQVAQQGIQQEYAKQQLLQQQLEQQRVAQQAADQQLMQQQTAQQDEARRQARQEAVRIESAQQDAARELRERFERNDALQPQPRTGEDLGRKSYFDNQERQQAIREALEASKWSAENARDVQLYWQNFYKRIDAEEREAQRRAREFLNGDLIRLSLQQERVEARRPESRFDERSLPSTDDANKFPGRESDARSEPLEALARRESSRLETERSGDSTTRAGVELARIDELARRRIEAADEVQQYWKNFYLRVNREDDEAIRRQQEDSSLFNRRVDEDARDRARSVDEVQLYWKNFYLRINREDDESQRRQAEFGAARQPDVSSAFELQELNGYWREYYEQLTEVERATRDELHELVRAEEGHRVLEENQRKLELSLEKQKEAQELYGSLAHEILPYAELARKTGEFNAAVRDAYDLTTRSTEYIGVRLDAHHIVEGHWFSEFADDFQRVFGWERPEDMTAIALHTEWHIRSGDRMSENKKLLGAEGETSLTTALQVFLNERLMVTDGEPGRFPSLEHLFEAHRDFYLEYALTTLGSSLDAWFDWALQRIRSSSDKRCY